MARGVNQERCALSIQAHRHVKEFCVSQLRADLVGSQTSSVSRTHLFGCRPRDSPLGALGRGHGAPPSGRVHRDGASAPQVKMAYRVQYWMNTRLDEISYRMGLSSWRRRVCRGFPSAARTFGATGLHRI